MASTPNPRIPVTAVDPRSLTHQQVQAALGALVGAAVGDALGAPFEFQMAGLYAERFPEAVLGGNAEMIGGGAFNWAPGEFTDDTQMAMALAEALLANGAAEFDMNTIWQHFVAWSEDAVDIGNTTRSALRHPDPATAAEYAHQRLNGRTGSNGSVMRIAPVGIAGVRWGQEKTNEIARKQSAITHFDPIAGETAAIAAEVIRACILGATFEQALTGALQLVDDEYKATFDEHLSINWHPDHTTVSNGGAVVCLAQAVWAIRNTSNFEDAITTVINLGDDTDTVAAVAGAMAGALYGMQRIPARWSTYVHGHVMQPDGSTTTYNLNHLQAIARRLVGKQVKLTSENEDLVKPTRIHDLGIHACNYLGAPLADTNMGIISLCRMDGKLVNHPFRREFYILDNWGENNNPHLREVTEQAVDAIDAFLAEGREVVVHCHGGRSRTGFILKAWYMRTFGVKHVEAHTWLKANWPHYVTWNDDFEGFIKHEWMQERN